MKTQETMGKTNAAKPKKGKAAKAKEPQAKAATPKKATKPTKLKGGSRPSSKADTVLELMKRKQGATLAEIAKATDWQNHSIRGFISGQVAKEDGAEGRVYEERRRERTYRIE